MSEVIPMTLIKKSKSLIVLGIIAFLVMSFWGLYSMPTNERGMMGDCPFMNHSTSLCQMSAAEHIAQWQQLFALVKTDKFSLFLFASLIIAFIVLTFPFAKNYRIKTPPLSRFRLYSSRYRPEIKLFNHLLLAFSQGILNPRIYA